MKQFNTTFNIILMYWFVSILFVCTAEREEHEPTSNNHSDTIEGSSYGKKLENNHTNNQHEAENNHTNESQSKQQGGHASKDNGHGEGSEGGGHGDESEGGHGSEEGHGSRLECNCECHEVEEEEEHAGHAIIWPCVVGMMLFISISGYLFYHFYTRYQMKNIMLSEEDHKEFFKEAMLSSTVAGIAAPGMLGFKELRKKSKLFSTSKENSAFN